MPEELKYKGEVRLHYCNNDECFPPTWFSMSQRPESCLDCKNVSRLATPTKKMKLGKVWGIPQMD